MIEAIEYHGERHASHEVFKGRLASTHGKVVIITKPDADGRILIVFKCAKVAGCSKFRVDLEVKPVLFIQHLCGGWLLRIAGF